MVLFLALLTKTYWYKDKLLQQRTSPPLSPPPSQPMIPPPLMLKGLELELEELKEPNEKPEDELEEEATLS